MLTQYCDGIDRRGFLRLGSLAGISLADVLRLQHAHGAEGVAKKDVNCIFIFIIGFVLVFIVIVIFIVIIFVFIVIFFSVIIIVICCIIS